MFGSKCMWGECLVAEKWPDYNEKVGTIWGVKTGNYGRIGSAKKQVVVITSMKTRVMCDLDLVYPCCLIKRSVASTL